SSMGKRGRKKGSHNARNTAIVKRCRELLNPAQPMTLRHLYYLLVSDPEIQLSNTQREYKNLTRLLSEERHKMDEPIEGDLMSGPIPCDALVDGTRDSMKWKLFTGLEDWKKS